MPVGHGKGSYRNPLDSSDEKNKSENRKGPDSVPREKPLPEEDFGGTTRLPKR